MTTILCGLPAFQPMHQPGFPAPDAGDKKFRLILRFRGVKASITLNSCVTDACGGISSASATSYKCLL